MPGTDVVGMGCTTNARPAKRQRIGGLIGKIEIKDSLLVPLINVQKGAKWHIAELTTNISGQKRAQRHTGYGLVPVGGQRPPEGIITEYRRLPGIFIR